MTIPTNKNKHIKRATLIYVLLFIIFSSFVFRYLNKDCTKLKCLSFPGKRLWKITNVYEDDKNVWRGLLSAPNYNIRLYKISNVKQNEADEFTKVKTMAIKGLFDTTRSPYPGAISDKITCPDNLKPEEEDLTSETGTPIHYFSSFLNDRLQYGACSENQISFKVFSGMFYCKNNSEWYQIELMVPIKSATENNVYKDMIKKAGCGN